MIAHYLKIGLRNICHYKQQSVVSMVGLAIGFVCFALSLLWIRYEITYNQDYPDSDRIFLLGEGRFDITFKSELHNYLTEHFPEIEKISSLCLMQKRSVCFEKIFYHCPFTTCGGRNSDLSSNEQ